MYMLYAPATHSTYFINIIIIIISRGKNDRYQKFMRFMPLVRSIAHDDVAYISFCLKSPTFAPCR